MVSLDVVSLFTNVLLEDTYLNVKCMNYYIYVHKMCTLRRHFLDHSICFVKQDSIKFVLDTLNSFRKNIKFTFEEEIDGKIPLLHALLV